MDMASQRKTLRVSLMHLVGLGLKQTKTHSVLRNKGRRKVKPSHKKPQHPHPVASDVEKESRGSLESRKKWKSVN